MVGKVEAMQGQEGPGPGVGGLISVATGMVGVEGFEFGNALGTK